MKSDFWMERWQKNEIGFHQQDFHQQLVSHQDKFSLPTNAKILVPLCGKTKDLMYLQKMGEVTGVELSPLATQQFFTENFGEMPKSNSIGALEKFSKEKIEIFCGDFFHLKAKDAGPFDFFFDRAAIVALPSAMRPDYAAKLKSLLTPKAQGLLITFEHAGAQTIGPPFSVQEEEIRMLFAPEFKLELLDSLSFTPQSKLYAQNNIHSVQEKVFKITGA